MTDPTRLENALTTIRTLWPLIHPTGPPAIRLGTTGESAEKPLPIPAPTINTFAGGPKDIPHVLENWARHIINTKHLDPHTPCTNRRPHTTLIALPTGHHGPADVRTTYLCGCGITPGSTTRRHPLSATDIPALAVFLRTHADHLSTNPIAVEEIAACANTIRNLADPRGAREFVGPCPSCGHDLRAYPGETAKCTGPGCMTEVSAREQRDQLVSQAEDKLLTAQEIVDLAPRLWDHKVTNVHITRWKNAGRLIPHGMNGKRPLYRVGDVARLAREQAESRRR